MEPEKFENRVKKVLGEREIKPSAAGWEKLEQRLNKNRKKRPYLLWMTSAAAIAAIFFVLGSYFNTPIASEDPQLVDQKPEEPDFEEKTSEPEMIRVAVSEEQKEIKEERKPSAERGVKNAIFEAPVYKPSAEIAEVSKEASEEAEAVTEKFPGLLEEIQTELAAQEIPEQVSDHEIEALLLLATAELEADPVYSVNPDELLDQVEYELDQSFRQKVFEVVKEGLLKAKTAVASDF
ncbi:MAG: hypothetical protein R3259_04310 [Salinimicrobium sediminis]|nr:hypothetical protein [Salinimicrobium sediminis]